MLIDTNSIRPVTGLSLDQRSASLRVAIDDSMRSQYISGYNLYLMPSNRAIRLVKDDVLYFVATMT